MTWNMHSLGFLIKGVVACLKTSFGRISGETKQKQKGKHHSERLTSQ
jgi:hypothetical protein